MGDTGIPASLNLEGRLGEDGFSSVMAGLSLYFGGEDKSLMRRHREDDPRLHFFDIFNSGFLGSIKPPGTVRQNLNASRLRENNYCENT